MHDNLSTRHHVNVVFIGWFVTDQQFASSCDSVVIRLNVLAVTSAVKSLKRLQQ